MITVIIFISICLLGIFFAIGMMKTKNVTLTTAQNLFDNIENFNASKKHVCGKRPDIIAIDESRKEVVIVSQMYFQSIQERFEYSKISGKTGSIPEVHRFKFNDVLSSELIQDNNVISKKSTIRTIGGVIAGGVIAGGVGAILGGLSGKSHVSSKVKSVEVLLTIKSLSHPIIRFRFFDSITDAGQKEVYTNNPNYSIAYKSALEWQSVFSIIIDQEDKIA